MTVNLDKCKTCQIWKDTKGRGTKACLKCNPFREVLPIIKPLDSVPDDVIEQYPDLQDGKIKNILDGVAHLEFWQATVWLQRHVLGATERELEERWAKPYIMGYSDSALREIVLQAMKMLQQIVKK